MKPSVASLLYIKYSRAETFASLRRLGIGQVDLWDHPGFGSHVSVSNDDSEEVLSDLATYGLKPSAVSLYAADPETMRAGIKYAAKIGAPLVVAGFNGATTEQFADFLRPLAVEGRRAEVRVTVENHVDTPSDSIDRVNALSALVPDIGYCYAPPHSVIMGENQQQNVTALGDRMAMFYLWDSPWMATGLTWFRNNWNRFSEEQFPGRGKLTSQFPALLETLRAIRFDGPVNFCVHGSREWPIEKTERFLAASMRFLGLS
ncbi:sugar phosphate isomerase/epimerase [Horticoccus luteus]|uniref:Sugar phosphate isomerase/epimerase n=1 Tax=Horticoccus luteus TaxID=2862869 RepID=A0A8F9TYQ3_9BACT|nr:sugar phosphate isomerase/epimerase [Horticoccus luteus]QYM80451.1 sugar phosphate isomerase/epimerase [Horticoccus luteus]